jgi:hypothetical protein
MYNASLSYATAHNGDLSSVPSDENGEYADLYKWIKYQRQSYRYYLEDSTGGQHSMTEEKVKKLKDAGFTWVVDDKVAWEAEASTTIKLSTTGGTVKRGRPRKTMTARSMLHNETLLLQSIIGSDQDYNDSDVLYVANWMKRSRCVADGQRHASNIADDELGRRGGRGYAAGADERNRTTRKLK